MTYTDDQIGQAARTAHEVNRAFCVELGDDSQLPWEEAPLWQKESAESGVRALVEKPGLTPEESHKGWMAEKEKGGWVWGKEKDVVLRTHPCMLPYGALSPEQRAKDVLFTAVVRGILHL